MSGTARIIRVLSCVLPGLHRALIAEKAKAWDEGYFLGVGLPAELGHTFCNPYRKAGESRAR